MQKNVLLNPPATSFNPLKDAVGVTSVDFRTQFDGLVKKVDNLEKFFKAGKAQDDLIRYLPGLAKPLYHGQLKGTIQKKAYAYDTYKDLKSAEFNIQLSSNQYINFHNVHLVFPLKIKKKQQIMQTIPLQLK